MSSENKEKRNNDYFTLSKQVLRLTEKFDRSERLRGFTLTILAIVFFGLLAFIVRMIIFIILGFEHWDF